MHLPRHSSISAAKLGQIGFFFFHTCLFWFKFILRIRFCFVVCVWISSFAHEQVSLFFLFFLLFFLISFGLWEKKKQRQWREWENERGKKKKKKQQREWEKKRNPDEGERIDKIRNWYNILMQEIQLLMYSSWSDPMSYYLFEKKNFRYS